MDYPWYQTLEKDSGIQQGDFVPDCPIVLPPAGLSLHDEYEVDVKYMDVIILTQSCDLQNKDIEIVLVCPYMSATTFLDLLPQDQTSSVRAKRKIMENIQKGHIHSYHLLNKEEGLFDDYLVVDFKNVYSVSKRTLLDLLSGLEIRTRLLPPYREHLSQSFARYFMRVGLPQDIYIH